MPRISRLNAGFVTGLAVFSGVADAFWRLPCRGRAGLARMDPLMDPGEPSYHVHSVHGSGAFSMDADGDTLKKADCTSCAVTQDKSAYWAPALYFMHDNGTTQIVDEVGGMLAYYLLYGENVEAFPEGFRMIAGDPFQRNFTWPVPDPPKSEWTGDQASQAALKQKALGFNCLNYQATAEPSLGRHFLPDKDYLDANCPDGVRFELMFPSCWNGKDVDTEDHASHVAYPSLVMDGTCPEGFETRVVSLFFETIWNTAAFKDYKGHFVMSHGDPTGYGYHGDFIHGWEQDVLEAAVKKCTNPSGLIEDCDLFDIQSDADQQKCKFDVPSSLKDEPVETCTTGVPNGLAVQWGPEYAFPISYTTSSSSAPTPAVSASLGVSLDVGGLIGNVFAPQSSSSSAEATPSSSAEPTSSATPTSSPTPSTPSVEEATPSSTSSTPPATSSQSSTPTPTPTPSTSYISGPVAEEMVYLEEEAVVLVDLNDKPYATSIDNTKTLATSTTTSTEVYSTDVAMVTPSLRKRGHSHGHRHRRNDF